MAETSEGLMARKFCRTVVPLRFVRVLWGGGARFCKISRLRYSAVKR